MNVTFSWKTEKTYVRPDPRKVKRLATRIAEVAGTGLDETQSLGVSFLSSAKMTEVNWDFLTHKGDTDVICFDYRADEPENDPETVEPDEFGIEDTELEPDVEMDDSNVGVDILVCPNVAFREAAKRNLPYAREVTLYLAHGLLHAAGYDDLQPKLKRQMRRAEKRVMAIIEKEFNLEDIFRLLPQK